MMVSDFSVEDVDKFVSAAGYGNMEKVTSFLCRFGPAIINEKQKCGKTALTIASFNGHDKVVSKLLEEGAAIEIKETRRENTALISASYNNCCKVVPLLIRAGADLEATNKEGKTALLESSEHGHQQVVSMLLEARANIDARNKRGDTALSLACSGGHGHIAQMLLRAGANLEIKNNVRQIMTLLRHTFNSISDPQLRERSRSYLAENLWKILLQRTTFNISIVELAYFKILRVMLSNSVPNVYNLLSDNWNIEVCSRVLDGRQRLKVLYCVLRETVSTRETVDIVIDHLSRFHLSNTRSPVQVALVNHSIMEYLGEVDICELLKALQRHIGKVGSKDALECLVEVGGGGIVARFEAVFEGHKEVQAFVESTLKPLVLNVA